MSSEPLKPSRLRFFDFSPDELDEQLAALGLPRFRGQQIREWVYGRLVTDVTQMSNLSARDRTLLAERFDFEPGKVIRRQLSEDGTLKLLLEWKRDGWPEPATTETVMIPDADRRTACVSSQIGCPVQCKFCASGLAGLKGNLDPGEIVFQIFALNRELFQQKERVTNVVFMGMGEPMSNYATVLRAIRTMHDPKCFNLGARRITVSTVGVPKRIRDLAGEELPLNLALSLHAPNEPLRKQLIPWADHFELQEILDACQFYFEQTGREITLEYILLHDVNDRPEHARELAKLCKTIRANVNLIRYNEVSDLPFLRPKGDAVLKFQQILRDAGVNAHVRKSRGRDIDAACGQLKRKAEQELIQLGAAKKAFTLTEMLVALVIVALLAATFVPYLLTAQESARRKKCESNLIVIRNALNNYVAKNDQQYPATRADPTSSHWTAFSGAHASTMDGIDPNDVTAPLWLLLKQGLLRPDETAVFVCPSSKGVPALPSDVATLRNFPSPDALSYGYAIPYSVVDAGYLLNKDRVSFRFAILADRGPPISTWNRTDLPRARDSAFRLATLNSPNHGGAGQNVLYPNSVEFVSTPYAGAGYDPKRVEPADNIYSAISPTPLLGLSPADVPGYVGPTVMPGYQYDAYLVPSAP